MGAACVRPIQHDHTKPFIGHHQNAYQVQPLRNQRPPLNSGSGNQNLSLTQLEQQLKQHQQQLQQQQQLQREQQQREQQQQQQREQQQREEQQREQQQREEQQREQQQREQQQREQQQREQQEQLQLQQQQQQLEQERQQQEEQQLQQQQFLPVTDAGNLNQIPVTDAGSLNQIPVTDAGSLNQTLELSDNLKSTTDKVPATDCHNETQVDSPKEIKRCDSLIDDDYCPTCFYGYETDNPKIATQCHHHYHLSCILEWMERSPTCPACGQVLIIL